MGLNKRHAYSSEGGRVVRLSVAFRCDPGNKDNANLSYVVRQLRGDTSIRGWGWQRVTCTGDRQVYSVWTDPSARRFTTRRHVAVRVKLSGYDLENNIDTAAATPWLTKVPLSPDVR